MRRKHLLAPAFLFSLLTGCTSYFYLPHAEQKLSKDSVNYIHLTDTLFHSPQVVNMLVLHNRALKKFTVTIGFNKRDLLPVSSMAKTNHAVAAINGGFFDRDKGGSVSYLEVNDFVIQHTVVGDAKWSKPDSLANGAIVWTPDHDIKIKYSQGDKFYEKSHREAAVLVAGPLLLENSAPQKLPVMDITTDRHPRTCLCMTREALIFITIDGRSNRAAGMTLYETQEYLSSRGCVDAINLDGGGSTTMWTEDKGVVNQPSDTTGERPVSNALLILKK